MKKFWLLKTEPDVFSFDDLVSLPKRTTHWEGVRNYQARNFMRDQIKLGDQVLIYHSNTEEPAIFGVAEIVKEGYPDFTATDPKSHYFDEKVKKTGLNPWIMVDVKATLKFKKPVTRSQLKASSKLAKILVLQKGSRLSVQPVEETHFEIIHSLGSPEKL